MKVRDEGWLAQGRGDDARGVAIGQTAQGYEDDDLGSEVSTRDLYH